MWAVFSHKGVGCVSNLQVYGLQELDTWELFIHPHSDDGIWVKKKIWMTVQGDFVYFKGDILCLFFLVHNFILSYYENRCSCLSAQKTHQFSHAVQCFCTLFPLRPFWAPVSLRTPAPEYPVCSGWSAHTCLSQLTTNSNRAIPWRHIFPCA